MYVCSFAGIGNGTAAIVGLEMGGGGGVPRRPRKGETNVCVCVLGALHSLRARGVTYHKRAQHRCIPLGLGDDPARIRPCSRG